MADLSIIIDSVQTRLSEDGISTLVSGKDWDPTSWDGVWVDGVTNTAMLRPGPIDPAWTTGTTYSHYGLSDFTSLTDSGNWQNNAVDPSGPFMWYTGSSGNTADLGGLGPSQSANQPMVVEWFQPSNTNSPYGVMECGWSDSGDGSSGVSLRFYANGKAEVWKTGALVGTYSISGKSQNYYNADQASIGDSAKNSYLTVMLIPCRDRELLILGSTGGGFAHVFQDLPETAGNTITDAANFWFNVPTPNTGLLRISQLTYAESGSIAGIPSAWRIDPSAYSTSVQTHIYQSLSGTGTVSLTVATSGFANPYSVPYPVQLQLSLGGGPSATPFVYGARGWYQAITDSTTGGGEGGVGIEVVTACRSFDLEASDSLSGVDATITLMRPAALADAGVVGVTTQCGRPAVISDSVGTVITAICEPPHWTDDYGEGSDGYDLAQDVELKARDFWKLAEDYVFGDPIPLDGMTLYDAYTLLATSMGLSSTVSSSASSVTLPYAGSNANGKWNVLVDVGDRGAEWLDRLHTTYAATWYHGVDQSGGLVLTDPGDMPSMSSLTLYRTIADAITAGHSADEAPYYVYRKCNRKLLEPEANDIWVTGYDFRTQRPIVVHKRDAASADPTTAAGSRPANWLGYLKKYGWVDPSLTTADACNFACNLLYDRLSVARPIYEFECEYLDGIWKGDLITLAGADEGDDVTVRIKTFSGRFELVDQDTYNWRPCRYVGEDTADGVVAPLGVAGTSANAIAANWQLRGLSKYAAQPDAVEAARRPIINMQEAA